MTERPTSMIDSNPPGPEPSGVAGTAPPAEQVPPDPTASQAAPGRRSMRDRAGWLGVAAITAVVAATWAPWLTRRFGDNHLGRVHGRYALHARNLDDRGLVGADFGAAWAPFSQTPYAHHPPLPNLLAWLFSILPGDGEWSARIGVYLLALLAIPAGAALLRGLGMRWGPTLLAVAAMAATGYYWLYAPVMFDIGLILALSALVFQLRQRSHPPRWLMVLACGCALLAILSSWPGIAFGVVLPLWLLIARRWDRVSVAVGGTALAAGAVSLAYMVGVSGVSDLRSQVDDRSGQGAYGDFTLVEYVERQWQWLTNLLPEWYLAVFPAAIVAGLLIHRTRWYTALASVFAAGWVLVLNQGSYIHDYWAYLLLVPGLVGLGALLDWVSRQLPGKVAIAGGLAAALGIGATAGAMMFGDIRERYLERPTAAGELVAEHSPPASQQIAWYNRFSSPRWLSYYWDLPTRELTAERLAQEAAPTDLVVLNMRWHSSWVPDRRDLDPIAQEGPYLLVRAGDLQRIVSE